jgi:hypothetical protein
MSPIPPRVRAGLVLVATLLPLCTFAAPLRIRLVRAESLVTDVPELNTATLQERSLYGLTQATQANSEKAELLPAGPLFDTAIGLFQHGGFLISLTVGATFL